MQQKLLIISRILLVLASIIGVIDSTSFGSSKENSYAPKSFSFGTQKHSKFFPEVYLIAGGDIMLSRNIGYLNKQQGYDRMFGSGKFNPISRFTNCISDHCLLFFNLESLFYPKDNDIPEGGYTFRANTNNIEVLRQLRQPSPGQENRYGRDFPLIVSLTNNHTINAGYEGIIMTQDVLHGGGAGDVSHIGAGTTTEEARRGAQYTFHETCENGGCTGLSICFQAYSYDGNENLKVGGGRIFRNAINQQQILADLEKMKELNCDAKILSLHRGAEYRIHPNQRQRTLAHTLIDHGADLILGGHSHVPGEIEKYKGKYIFYSLGNFIFDQDRGKRASGPEFDYIYDYSLGRRTVPTYIAMLAGIKIVKYPKGTKIFLDRIEMSRTTDGVHTPLDEETKNEVMENIRK